MLAGRRAHQLRQLPARLEFRIRQGGTERHQRGLRVLREELGKGIHAREICDLRTTGFRRGRAALLPTLTQQGLSP